MSAERDEMRARIRAVRDTMAPGWETARQDPWAFSRPISKWLVDRLAPPPGQTILDLAAGLGHSGFLAARRVGKTGRVPITARTLDAIHLASMSVLRESLPDLAVLRTDERVREDSAQLGFEVRPVSVGR